jgi:lipid-A-disaccharide synthase
MQDRTEISGMGPRTAVSLQFLHSLGETVVAPLHLAAHLFRHGKVRERILEDLASPSPIDPTPPLPPLPERPLEIFLSCAEHSGETHARSLVHALREELSSASAPPPHLSGLGSSRLGERGVELIGDPVSRAAMGADVLGSIPFYLRLLTRTAEHLRRERPDLCVLVDSPALHVPLGRIAHRYSIPVVHFVTPQYWGWAPWRVGSYRRAIDLALTILPFEAAWFRRHAVRTAHIGHPLLDALPEVPARGDEPPQPVLVLLPGSREKVVGRNLPWMLVAASRLRLLLPHLEVVIPRARPALQDAMRGHLEAAGAETWARIETGPLHQTLARAGAALSVSGTVLLDLLHHRLPAVVIYRLDSAIAAGARDHLLTVPWFASTNLLAGREVLPEYCFRGEGPLEEVCNALHRCYKDPSWRAKTREGLDEAARRLGPPGAAARAARHALALASPLP